MKTKDEIVTWLSQSVTSERFRRHFLIEPTTWIEAYANHESERSDMQAGVEGLSYWHLVNFELCRLSNEEGADLHLAHASTYMIASTLFASQLDDTGIVKGWDAEIPLGNVGLILASIIICNWKNDAKIIANRLISGLDRSLLDLRLTPRHEAGSVYRHVWFLLHLMSEHFDIPMDISKYSYPPNMQPYARALTQWKSDNIKVIREITYSLCDFHVEQTRRMIPDVMPEFDREPRMFFPFEILAFLRLREWCGLRNPENINHPLMDQPLAHLPSETLLKPDLPSLDAANARFQEQRLAGEI